jgi:hypothetical protein
MLVDGISITALSEDSDENIPPEKDAEKLKDGKDQAVKEVGRSMRSNGVKRDGIVIMRYDHRQMGAS